MTDEGDRNRRWAWWSEPGPDLCSHCLRDYHLEVGYHCAACDEPVCPVCVVTVRPRGAVLCPRCAGEDSP